MQVKASNVSPPPASSLNNTTPYSNYHYPTSYNPMDLYNFPPAHSMSQPPNYSSHYMSGSNFFRPPSASLSSAPMSEYELTTTSIRFCSRNFWEVEKKTDKIINR